MQETIFHKKHACKSLDKIQIFNYPNELINILITLSNYVKICTYMDKKISIYIIVLENIQQEIIFKLNLFY